MLDTDFSGDAAASPNRSLIVNAHILIVEDEDKIAALLQDYLRLDSFDSSHLARGDMVEDWLTHHQPDLIVLDIMLPGLSGLELCRRIRQRSQVPIILLTARIEEIDRLLGLELGADDYICKPFSPREVVARVKTVLRRSRGNGNTPAKTDLRLDRDGYQAWLCGHNLELTAVEFQLLATLAEHPGRIFNREQLMNIIYNDHRIVADRTIDSHIKKIRRKIAALAPEQELIHSLYGVGYKFEWL